MERNSLAVLQISRKLPGWKLVKFCIWYNSTFAKFPTPALLSLILKIQKHSKDFLAKVLLLNSVRSVSHCKEMCLMLSVPPSMFLYPQLLNFPGHINLMVITYTWYLKKILQQIGLPQGVKWQSLSSEVWNGGWGWLINCMPHPSWSISLSIL